MPVKKNILLSAASLLALNAFADTNTPQESTISFSKNSELVVKSTTALVNVTVNATALQGDNTIIQKAAIQNLSVILPKVDWKVVDYKETQADSGAQNIKLVIQARLTEQEIKSLQKELKNTNSNNSRFNVEVVSFDPTTYMINQAQDDMMISMYQSVKQYVDQFNAKTSSHYFIRSISYGVNDSPVAGKALVFAKMDMPVEDQQGNTADDFTVSKKMTMSAYVTLAQKDEDLAGKASKEGQITMAKLLPPAYLQVSGYQQCLQTVNKGTWTAWCMPKTQPQGCGDDSWKALLDLKVACKLNGMGDCA
jgi:hypothetical protein